MDHKDQMHFRYTADHVTRALGRVEGWRDAHPEVADYRVTAALSALKEAERMLRHLEAGTHTPEWERAMASFRATLTVECTCPHRDVAVQGGQPLSADWHTESCALNA